MLDTGARTLPASLSLTPSEASVTSPGRIRVVVA
ncbi:MAG: hypothetical protein JWN88_1957, partial [Frankiales bacterium]|nr:hypothetical protein [Frankiales bacterium]